MPGLRVRWDEVKRRASYRYGSRLYRGRISVVGYRSKPKRAASKQCLRSICRALPKWEERMRMWRYNCHWWVAVAVALGEDRFHQSVFLNSPLYTVHILFRLFQTRMHTWGNKRSIHRFQSYKYPPQSCYFNTISIERGTMIPIVTCYYLQKLPIRY